MKKGLVYGVGINDYSGKCYNPLTDQKEPFYATWQNMIEKCYSAKYQKDNSPFKGCTVCDRWKSLKIFRGWFLAHYHEGWEISRTLFNKDNKVYAPYLCCFLPKEIKAFMSNHHWKNKELPSGVYHNVKNRKGYRAAIRIENKMKYLGVFPTIEQARNAYKTAREQRAHELAEKYKCYLEGRAYQALINYKEE